MAALSAKRPQREFSPVSVKTRRQTIERQIEALIDQLDALDGDADAEDDGTAEPSLGWSLTYAGGSGDDCEDTSPEWYGGRCMSLKRTASLVPYGWLVLAVMRWKLRRVRRRRIRLQRERRV